MDNTTQYQNTPRYSTDTGLLTDYGKSLGLTEVNKPVIGMDTANSNEKPFILPEKTKPTLGGLDSMLGGLVDQNKTQAETERDLLKTQSGDALKMLMNEVVSSGTISSEIDREAQDLAKQKSDKYTSMIEQEALSARRKIEALQKNPEGMGVGMLESRMNDIERESLAKQADIGILQTAAARDYETAASIADRQLQMKMEQSKANIDALNLFYDEYKDQFNKVDERLYNEAITKANREYEKQLSNEQAIKDIKMAVAQSGAGLGVINSLSNIDTTNPNAFDEALKIATPYIKTVSYQQLKNGDTVVLDSQGKVIRNLGGGDVGENNYVVTKDILDTIHGGDVVSTIANVIKNSGAKQSQSTNDAINVISGIQQLVKDNPEGEFPGIHPIARVPGFIKSNEALTNLSDLEAINLKVQQWASGAALTEAQTKQVGKMTPRKGDTDKQMKAKINALANYMVSQVSGQLAGQGVSFVMDTIDYFNKKPLDIDPLKINDVPLVGGQDSLNLFK